MFTCTVIAWHNSESSSAEVSWKITYLKVSPNCVRSVKEEVPITVSRWASDKEARPNHVRSRPCKPLFQRWMDFRCSMSLNLYFFVAPVVPAEHLRHYRSRNLRRFSSRDVDCRQSSTNVPLPAWVVHYNARAARRLQRNWARVVECELCMRGTWFVSVSPKRRQHLKDIN